MKKVIFPILLMLNTIHAEKHPALHVNASHDKLELSYDGARSQKLTDPSEKSNSGTFVAFVGKNVKQIVYLTVGYALLGGGSSILMPSEGDPTWLDKIKGQQTKEWSIKGAITGFVIYFVGKTFQNTKEVFKD